MLCSLLVALTLGAVALGARETQEESGESLAMSGAHSADLD